MSDPMIRYVLALLAFIVIIRFVLNKSAIKNQEKSDQTDEVTTDSENQVGQMSASQDEQSVIVNEQPLNPREEETGNE